VPRAAIDPCSERLQLLEPRPAWDGADYAGMPVPVLIRTHVKTTTDQITPAGAWMRFRSHLNRSTTSFSVP